MKSSDERFTEDAKALFDESVERLDAATLSTLNRNRHEALERARGAKRRWLRWAPASSQTPWGDVLGGPHLPSPPLANR